MADARTARWSEVAAKFKTPFNNNSLLHSPLLRNPTETGDKAVETRNFFASNSPRR